MSDSPKGKIKKIYGLDSDRPDHMRINDALEKLSKGMHSELIIAFLSRLFSDAEADPAKVAKLFISSGVLPTGERVGAVATLAAGGEPAAKTEKGNEKNSLEVEAEKGPPVKSKLSRLGI